MPLDEVVRKGLGEQIDLYLSRAQAFGFVGSVSISKGDELLLSKGYGLANKEKEIPFTHNTILDIGSLSKQFTATAILVLEQEGLLTTNTTLDQFFDDVPSDKTNITLHHILTHSSGLPLIHGSDWEYYDREKFIRGVLAEKLLFEPGTQYSYSNPAFSLLANIIENLSGKSFQEYLTETFFRPIGLEKIGWYGDPSFSEEEVAHVYVEGKDGGSPFSWPGPFVPLLGNGGICCSIRELHKWMQAIKNRKFLTEQSTTKLFTPFLEDTAYGWDVRQIEQGRRIWHNGGTDTGANSELTWFSDIDILMIVFSNEILTGEDVGYMATRPIQSILFNRPYTIPPSINEKVEYTKLAKYKGFYEIPDSMSYKLWTLANYLLLSPIDQAATYLYLFPKNGPPKEYELFDKASNRLVNDILQNKFSYLQSLVLDENRFPVIRLILQRFLKTSQEKLGCLNGFQVICTTPFKENGDATWIKLKHEKGETGFGIVWENNRILRITESFYPSPVIVPLIPLSSTEFLGHSIFFHKNVQINFERNNGSVDGFRFGEARNSLYVPKRTEENFT